MLGFDRDSNVVNLDDSAEVYATLADENDTPLTEDDLLSVKFTIQKPDRTKESLSGQIMDDGRGFLRYEGTDSVGEYMCVAQFTLTSGEVRSTRSDFEVIDPFNPPVPEFADLLSGLVWRKLEDCFDSEDGGPWLRDMTLSYFSKDKMPQFVEEGVMELNLYPPMTDLTTEFFDAPREDGSYPFLSLLVESTFLAVVRHLMVSYVEQPQPTGAQIVYEDRRDYLQRWQLIYNQEWTLFERRAKLFKRQFYHFRSKMLIHNKAGRNIHGPMRQWNAARGYGYGY